MKIFCQKLVTYPNYRRCGDHLHVDLIFFLLLLGCHISETPKPTLYAIMGPNLNGFTKMRGEDF